MNKSDNMIVCMPKHMVIPMVESEVQKCCVCKIDVWLSSLSKEQFKELNEEDTTFQCICPNCIDEKMKNENEEVEFRAPTPKIIKAIAENLGQPEDTLSKNVNDAIETLNRRSSYRKN